ncbi:MAG TPA: PAS domain S-box protein [Terriglobales bacterium]|nr:PAS domain S-box protein [Terriglobales bacterium]
MLPEKDILFVAPATELASTRNMLLAGAGYPVRWVNGINEAETLLTSARFPLVILGKEITSRAQQQIAALARQRAADTRILAIGHDALGGVADLYLGRMTTPGDFLRAVGLLLMQAHGHPEVAGDYVMYVDADRRYICVTDGVCDLLGYDREDLLGMSIDDVTYPKSADVPAQFEAYRRDGEQHGRFLLRHRSGSPVAVGFAARVLPDGCMVSVLSPAE